MENSDSIGGTNKTSEIPKDVSSEVEAADDDNDQQEQHPTKSKLRSAWEWKHRILGMSLLALSWYNCNSGLERFALLFGEEYDKTAAFWGFTAGLTGLIIVLDVAQRARRGRASK